MSTRAVKIKQSCLVLERSLTEANGCDIPIADLTSGSLLLANIIALFHSGSEKELEGRWAPREVDEE